ncbi:N-acetylmuramoyl-L-alanine amidase [Pseudomonas asplenii]|uniref:N-acetylmuramoyl-L-alanine amidase n=1 Tax=Pseudomonas asplenii TaxID=53407 RepID=UPI001ED8EDA7|nr:N-acetylmuramoyl-L-alanine amidase [Pseudomonas fuscovaginae]
MRFRALLAVAGLLFAALTVDAVAATQVKSVRLWRAPDNTRLVFDLSGSVQHSVFTLTAPDRLVIDINGATLAGPLNVPTANTPITSVRAAQRTPTDLRVVVDLKKAVTPKSFTLAPNAQYGNRLVVDLFDNPADAAPPPTPASNPTPSVATLPAVPVTPAEPAIKLPPAPAGKRDIIVVIDAGHGGEDPGASGSRGQHEKDVVLSIARELQRQVNGQKGYRAELTRTGDYFIPLRGRTEIARKKGADLFVSIHADAAPSAAAFGASVFALSDRGATSETARWLADSENPFRPDRRCWQRQPRRQGQDASRRAAGPVDDGVHDLQPERRAEGAEQYWPGHSPAQATGRAGGLHGAQIAGYSVDPGETGFISNSNEASKLASTNHQQALARSISSGIRQFFQQNPPPGTYIAWLRDSGKIAQGPRDHRVAPGETLAMLAVRYQVSVATLRSVNSLSSDELKVGQTLTIPGTELAAKQ